MKKIIALLLATIICLSLVACNNPSEGKDENPSTTEEVEIDHVELTLENFDEYFEFIDEGIFTKNSSDIIDALRFRQYYKLKDNVKIDMEKSNVSIEYKYKSSIKDITVDFKNQKYTIGNNEKDVKIIENIKVNKISNITYKDCAILLYQPNAVKEGAKEFNCLSDFELTNVTGTLYFVK